MDEYGSFPLESETPRNLRDEEAKIKVCCGLDNAVRMRQEAERLQARFQARRVARNGDAAAEMMLVKLMLMKKANAALTSENVTLQKALVAASRKVDVSRKDSLEMERLRSENEFFRAAITALVLKHNTTVNELARVVQKRKRGLDDDDDDCDLYVKKARRE